MSMHTYSAKDMNRNIDERKAQTLRLPFSSMFFLFQNKKEYPNLSGVLKVNPTLGENVGCE